MKLKSIIAVSATLVYVNAANAQVAGSFILNVGWTQVTPRNTSYSLGHNANMLPPVGPHPGRPTPGEISNPPSGNPLPPPGPLPGRTVPGWPITKPHDGGPPEAGSFSSMLGSEQQIGSSNFLPNNLDLSHLVNGGVKAESAAAFGLSGIYFITDNIAGELAISTPSNHSLKGTNGYGQLGEIGSIRMWSPALLLKYYFLEAENKFRPYVGAGISRTWFSETRFELPNSVPGTTTLSLKNKWAPVFNIGFSYQFTDHLFGNVSATYIPLETTATTRTTINWRGVKDVIYSSDKLKLNPITTFVGLGYRF